MSRPDAVDESTLTLFNACLCCNISLYTDVPDCCGCSSKSEFCCFTESLCCKSNATLTSGCDTSDDNCIIGCVCCECGLKKPETCCMGQTQICCLVSSSAYPPTDEVPLACALFGLACLPKCGCCKTQGELQGYVKDDI